MNISQLIIEADSCDPKCSQSALQELISLGIDSAQPIVEKLERAEPYSFRSNLNDVLLRITNPEIVPLLANYLNSANVDLSITSFKVLGNHGDNRAFLPLVEQLSNSNNTSNRCLAAHALGELRNRNAVEPLLNVAQEILHNTANLDASLERLLKEVEEEWDIDPLRLIVSISTSLAKFGNHLLAPVVIGLTYLNPEELEVSEVIDDLLVIRSQATEALCHTVGHGMLPALQKAVCEGNVEIRNSALEALFYLGLRESIETLVSTVNDPSTQVAHNATVWFNRLTGTDFEPFEDDPSEIRDWWHSHQNEYQSSICYRFGKPLLIKEIIEDLDTPNSTSDLVREIYIVTGKNLSRESRYSNEEVLTLAKHWWNSQVEKSFTPGKLYKYGQEQDITLVY